MLRRIIVALIANAIGLLAAAYFVSNFTVNVSNLTAFAALVAVFTFVTLIVRPIIKLVLSPLIIVTLGLFNLVINGALLYIVDKYSDNITISGPSLVPFIDIPVALVYGTLIITVVNLIFHVSDHLSHRS